MQIEQDSLRKKIRVTSIGAQGGMRVSLLIDPEGQVRRKVTDLGPLGRLR